MIVLKLLLFTLFISVSKCRIPDKVYCANKDCNGKAPYWNTMSVFMCDNFLKTFLFRFQDLYLK